MQILKQDWPAKWQSFIPDLVGASKQNETLCENSMIILKLLSEEIFDYSKGELTQVRSNPEMLCGMLFGRAAQLNVPDGVHSPLAACQTQSRCMGRAFVMHSV